MKSSFKINAFVPASFVNPNAGILDQPLKLDIEATVEYTQTEYMSVLGVSERFLDRFMAIVEGRCGIKPIIPVESTDPVSPEEHQHIVYPNDISSEIEWFDCSVEVARCLILNKNYNRKYYPASLKVVASMEDAHPIIRRFARDLDRHLRELLEDSNMALAELDERLKVFSHAGRVWAERYDYDSGRYNAYEGEGFDLLIEALQDVTAEEEYLANGNRD